jgi:hypothetical protein
VDDLRKFSLDIIKKNPELGGEIVDLFSMMMEEVEDGSSEELERDRFVCSVEELVYAKEEKEAEEDESTCNDGGIPIPIYRNN